MNKNQKLTYLENTINDNFGAKEVKEIFKMIGAPDYDVKDLEDFKLYSDYLPMGDHEDPYTPQQRYLHILWDSIDLVPLGLDAGFAIAYRQIIAKKLFKRCGKAFIANDHCRFNYGHHIEVGDFAAWNSNVFIDSKADVKFGDHSMLAENVTIFSHAHSESNHMKRIYAPVEIGPHVILGAGCTIMQGVTIGKGAFVGIASVVTKDVLPQTVVVGSPAKKIRDTKREGKSLDEVNHYMLDKDSFLLE